MLTRLSSVLVSLAFAAGACGGSNGSNTDAGTNTDASPNAACGDRRIDLGEECDDGNVVDGDGCDSMCLLETSTQCGDGNVDLNMGEQCDDGNTTAGDGCDVNCRVEAGPSCGDGNLDIADGEQCDDGNTAPGDGCSPTCQFELLGAFCGDGQIDPGEACDDGNVINGDACSSTCNFTNQTSLFAGTPTVQGSLDGVGSSATLGGFGGLTVDNDYLWYGDGVSRTLRRIEIATADVVTVAGDGVMRVVDDPDGSLASFNTPEGLATDGNTVWVSESRRIRAVQASAPFGVTTVAGDGTQGCTDGIGAAARANDIRGVTYYGGFVWFLDANCATLRRFDPGTAEVMTMAGMANMTGVVDGVGSAARFVSPRYMASDNSGILYIADTNGSSIRAFNTVTNEVTTFAGDGTQGYVDGIGMNARIHRPRGVAADGTSIYWSEFNQHTLRQGISATQEVTTMIGTPGMAAYLEGTGTAARMNGPYGIAYHFPSGSLFFIDSANFVIRRIQ